MHLLNPPLIRIKMPISVALKQRAKGGEIAPWHPKHGEMCDVMCEAIYGRSSPKQTKLPGPFFWVRAGGFASGPHSSALHSRSRWTIKAGTFLPHKAMMN